MAGFGRTMLLVTGVAGGGCVLGCGWACGLIESPMGLTFTESSLLLSVLDREPARVSPPELALSALPSVPGLNERPESGER